MKKYAIVGLLILLIIPLAYAIPQLILDVHPITDEIPYNGIAHFQIEVTNNQEIYETIYVPTPRNEWDITVPSYIFQIAPGESETIEIFLSPPEDIKAGKYAIYFEFRALNDTDASTYEYLNLDISSEKPPVIERIKYIESVAIIEKSEEGFLETIYTIKIDNQGNTVSSGRYNKLFTNLEAFFVQTTPGQSSMDDVPNGKQFFWDYSLNPGEELTIEIKVSLLPLLIAIILIVIAILLLGFYYRSSYDLTKEILLMKSEGEHEKRVKIRINVKNNTNQRQTNVMIQDYVPTPLHLTKKDFGTIEPNTIKKKGNRIIITWKFDVLEPREERVLSYGMRSRLKVIGKVFLPQAVLVQKIGKKKQVTIRSKMIKLEI